MNKLKKIICAVTRHSKISETCFGYRYCGRCGEQVGDSLGGVDYDGLQAVLIGHKCKKCVENYKKCTWVDKLLTPNPF